MGSKEYITIFISGFAFLVSFGSFLLALNASRRKTYDDQRLLRSSMNDVIAKIFAIRIDLAKYIQENPDWMLSDLKIAVNNAYNNQLNSYALLGVYISDKIKNLVSDIELATISETFAGSGDQNSAISYFKMAIEHANNKHYKVVHRRNLGAYLFNIGQIAAGRQEFQQSLELFPDNEDLSKAQNGATYKFWAISELRTQNNKMSEDYFAYAKDVYNSISNNQTKAALLTDLTNVMAQAEKFKANIPSGMSLELPSTGPPLSVVVPTRPAE